MPKPKPKTKASSNEYCSAEIIKLKKRENKRGKEDQNQAKIKIFLDKTVNFYK